MVKLNREMKAGTDAATVTDVQVNHVSQTIAKPTVSGSLPMWTEIHVQPLNVDDIENSKVYWIKHPHKKWSVYDKDLVTAMKDFIERWSNDR